LDTEASHSGLAAVKRVAHAVTPAGKKHGFALAFLMEEETEQNRTDIESY
jgi:hypothetical protein